MLGDDIVQLINQLGPLEYDVQLRTSEHRSMYSYVRLRSIDVQLVRLSIDDVQYVRLR